MAKTSDISLERIIELNPNFKRLQTPHSLEKYEVWFPAELSERILSRQAELKIFIRKSRSGSKKFPQLVAHQKYRVRKGESLNSIARKYKMSLGHLKRINKLEGNRVLAGGSLRTQADTYEPSALVKYKVKRGDNLSIIAKKFGTSVKRIKLRNRTLKSRIVAGQILRIETSEL